MKRILAILIAGMLGVACGSQGRASVCDPGETQPCVCPGGLSGAQICDDDGSGWGECICESSDAEADSDVAEDNVEDPLDDGDVPEEEVIEPECGNGEVEGDEECDDGNDVETDECLSTCEDASCGDGYIWDGHEECDDANYDNSDGCVDGCVLADCGDGFVWHGIEECDDGTGNSDTTPDACRTDCTNAGCGDDVIDTGEDCEGTELGGNDCTTIGLGFTGGVLACFITCDFDTSLCGTDWVPVTAGSFTMGSPTSEPGRQSDETQHTVTLSRPFEIMDHDVTQGEFSTVMGYNPSTFSACGTTCPVEQVNWHEAAAYANALSVTAGLPVCYACTGSGTGVSCSPSSSYSTPYVCPGYRLPTEAEWEYAARAGTTGGTYNGTSTLTDCTSPNTVLDSIVWYCGNSAGVTYSGCLDISIWGGCCGCAGTHPVRGKTPNAWGLYDMLGNVWNWCHDYYGTYPGTITDPWGPSTGSTMAMRGSSWRHSALYTRSAYRNGTDGPGLRANDVGFRIVRTLP